MTDADWLATVAASPDDPLVRLVYADWLDDQGDPRGEQLRLDVALTGMADDDPVAEPMRRRLAELVPGTDARWRAAICYVPAMFDGWQDDGSCNCLIPAGTAPNLFGTSPNNRHRLERQPRTPGEVATLCVAARRCIGWAVRYTGTDPVVIRMLGNNPGYCDYPIPPDESGSAPADPSPDYRGVAYVTAVYQELASKPPASRWDQGIAGIVMGCVWFCIAMFGLFVVTVVAWVLHLVFGD